MKAVFLIGYMGCGKTTLGEPLARVMGRRFVDLDLYIEGKCGMTAKEVFGAFGEAHFRQLEREALEEVAADDGDVIVACGGGTPLRAENMELMNRVGVTVWLQTSVERIVSRLVLPEQRSKRPLLNDMNDREIMESVAEGLEMRTPYYEQAQLQFDSTYLESEEEIEETAHQLAQLLMQREFDENKSLATSCSSKAPSLPPTAPPLRQGRNPLSRTTKCSGRLQNTS